MQSVNRDTPTEKIAGLVNSAPKLFAEMEHLEYLHSLSFGFTTKRLNLIRDLSTLLAFAVNFFMIYSGGIRIIDGKLSVYHSSKDYNAIRLIKIFGVVQLITSCLMILFYFVINAPLILKEKWRNAVLLNKNFEIENIEKSLTENNFDLSKIKLNDLRNLVKVKGKYDGIFIDKYTLKRNYGHNFIHFEIIWTDIKFLFGDASFMYMMFYILISLIGLTVSEIAYCFHLFDIIVFQFFLLLLRFIHFY